MKRCVIYTRESLLDIPEQMQNSIKIQKLFCKRFIQEHSGWMLIDQEYDDVGYDADTLDRPALQRLFNDVQHSNIDYVIVHKINRLATFVQVFSEILQTLAKSNTSIVPVLQIDDEFLTSGNPVYIKKSLLKGLVKCSICGEVIDTEIDVYVCKNHPDIKINTLECEKYVIDEIRKLLREPALSGLNPWQLEKFGLTHEEAFKMAQKLDEISILHLIVQSVVIGEGEKISIILRHDFMEKILKEIAKK